MSFREECQEWLKPFGYSEHSNNGKDSYYVFMHQFDFSKPLIICKIENGEKRCELIDASYKYFLQMKSGEIQFKHPDIKKYIDIMSYYHNLAERFQPPSELFK